MAKKFKKSKKETRRFQHLQNIKQQTTDLSFIQPSQKEKGENEESIKTQEVVKKIDNSFPVFKDLKKVLFFFVFVAICYGVLYYVINFTNLVKF